MKKLDKIKDYFIKNNITTFIGAYCKNPKDESFTLSFTFDLYDFNALNKEFIICLKRKNISYFKDFLSKKPKYQKIGDYSKGEKLAYEIILYFNSDKYVNFPNTFIESQKQTYFKNYKENIKKYEKFWVEKISEYPECFNQIINRLNNDKLIRKLKLEKLNKLLKNK